MGKLTKQDIADFIRTQSIIKLDRYGIYDEYVPIPKDKYDLIMKDCDKRK